MIMEAEAEAEAIALKGDAEAYAIEIKAKVNRLQMNIFKVTILKKLAGVYRYICRYKDIKLAYLMH